MTFRPNRRLWISTIAILLATALGALAGYLTGRHTVQNAAEAVLQQDATPLSNTIHSLVVESHDILAKANALQTPTCSDAEIAQLRLLLYHSVNFREIGRIRDGKILCSAVFGKDHLPQAQFTATYHYSDGTTVFRDMAPYVVSGTPVFIRQRGNFFAVESPELSVHIHEMRKTREVFSSGATSLTSTAPLGRSKTLPGATIDHETAGRIGDNLFGTVCTSGSIGLSDSVHGQVDCATSFGSLSAALHAQRSLLALYAFRGAVPCGLTSALVLLLYWRRRSMPQQLIKAIRADRLYFVYQPIVDLSSGHIVAAETLARWKDDDGLQVGPDIFIPLAEERGLALEVARLALRHTLHDLGDTLRSDDSDFRVHINLTASDLADPQLLPMLEDSLTKAGVSPHKLVLELTESATARHSVAIEAVHRLRERGHSVQIDDFGTGYSSLAYLKDLAVDAIKIDKAFTQSIGTDSVTGIILPQILTLAAGLGLLVIAEGIEIPEQAAYFASFDLPVMGQGWLYGKPQCPGEFLSAIAAQDEQRVAVPIENNATTIGVPDHVPQHQDALQLRSAGDG
ncbi:sensor c-di-GMP phosphodiesterase-like protein [Granulicella aggregans]|uniref:cyclic-guanylate-specific phosphodiesterase n=1 Tax=Granulicella aggregans TaxID=474949 RepID=A0A7W8E3S5_9BACT|nr:EAL domain-containing protein [Granulicella aggregans]MBB5057544.1 sensor c-di-GMP phosphodiesterase-like protein [Granulicella aggregans]